MVIRWRHRDDNTISQTDAWLSDATPDVTLSEFARVAKAEQRIEECLQRGKSQTGLADYERVRFVATVFRIRDECISLCRTGIRDAGVGRCLSGFAVA